VYEKRHIATDAACSVVCVSPCWAQLSCAKTVEPIKMSLGLTHVGPRNHVLDRGQDRTDPFAAVRGDRMAVQPTAKLPWTLVCT